MGTISNLGISGATAAYAGEALLVIGILLSIVGAVSAKHRSVLVVGILLLILGIALYYNGDW
jgi:uncharacterized membrane protein HdeD (DUF308 family)